MNCKLTTLVSGTLLLAILVVTSVGCRGDRRAHQLIKAIDAGNSQVVDTLLDDETLDVKASEDAGATFLFHAMAVKNKPAYVKLLEKGASPNHCDHAGRCVMNEAAELEDSFWLKETLAHGGDPDALNTGNRHAPNSTPLLYAISERRVENTKILIDAGADVNHRDAFGSAPLHEASGNGKYESMVALLEAGADPTQANKHGHSFVDWFETREGESSEYLVRNKDQLPWFRKVRDSH